jgi:Response regulator receiver domain
MVHHGDVSDPLVLVVEEEPMVREVLARYLERDGFRVDAVWDFEQAIEAFSTARPDLVVLDLMLPRVNGFEVFPASASRHARSVQRPMTPRSRADGVGEGQSAIGPEPRSGWPSRRQANGGEEDEERRMS